MKKLRTLLCRALSLEFIEGFKYVIPVFFGAIRVRLTTASFMKTTLPELPGYGPKKLGISLDQDAVTHNPFDFYQRLESGLSTIVASNFRTCIQRKIDR
jgi:hypothetical protein